MFNTSMKGSNSSFNSLLLSLGGSLVLTSWRTHDTLASVPARILNLTGLVSVAFSSPVQVEMKPNCQFLFEAEGVDVASCDLQIKNADCHISKKGEKMVWKRHLRIWVTHLHLQMQQQNPFSVCIASDRNIQSRYQPVVPEVMPAACWTATETR